VLVRAAEVTEKKLARKEIESFLENRRDADSPEKASLCVLCVSAVSRVSLFMLTI
jgi:hypothetical protein